MHKQKIYHNDDIAISTLKSFSQIEKSLGLDKKEAIPDYIKGKVEIIGKNVEGLKAGDVVYCDPGFTHNIKELGLIVLDKKGVLLVDQ